MDAKNELSGLDLPQLDVNWRLIGPKMAIIAWAINLAHSAQWANDGLGMSMVHMTLFILTIRMNMMKMHQK